MDKARPVNLVEFHKNVLSCFNIEKVRSEIAVETACVLHTFNKKIVQDLNSLTILHFPLHD